VAVNPSDVAQWLELAKDGDDAARNRLFAACRSYVGLRARVQMEKRLQGKVDASDLVQQSMLDAHRGFEDFSGTTPEEWFAWLNRVVARNAVDLVRHYVVAERRAIGREYSLQGNGAGESGSAFQHEPAAAAQTPSQVVMQWERQLELAMAIEKLPADYREVVVMRNILQLPFEEVARRLGRTTGAAQMLWMRAVEKLRSEFSAASPESLS
jgi:RNA polymerase sigma-70 factor (ECF subfamily)